MSNFTIMDYKIAIRTQYEIAIEKDVSGILSDPTPAQLRDFYLRLFEKGLNEIDKEILGLFFGAKENFSLKKAIENFNIGKLKPIINFLEGTNTENRARIEMAAILVGFQHRPYRNFEKLGTLKKEYITKNQENQLLLAQKSGETYLTENENKAHLEEKKNEKEFESLKEETQSSKSKSDWKKYIMHSIVALSLIGLIIYLALPEKQCMQWSNDHYEMVDCDLKIEGLGMANKIEILDKSLVNLQKVNVCDTTTCFDKNGQAVIWYAKTANGIDFFNGHGRHPETNGTLRPVTRYILNKYVKK